MERWLASHGVHGERLEDSPSDHSQVILVGDLSDTTADRDAWIALMQRVAQGSVAVFLSPLAFKRGEDAVGWLPLANKGKCYAFHDWLYHKECVAKTHPIFDGLQAKGIMDWDYYGQVIPRDMFDGQDTPDDVAAAAFALGYPCPGGYASGVLVSSYRFCAGRFVLNTLRVLEHLDAHPAADRLLLNMIAYAARFVDEPVAPLPEDFEERLRGIGYVQ
ncbi:MAG: hypothetical protein HY710_13550 [Candidatus Latescibacteria bacterium]|nr:hypothetical protein [Candidatus Latescibacterota bacterium]